MYGTTTPQLKTAKFSPVYVTRANQVTLEKPKGTDEWPQPWTQTLEAASLPQCVLARNIKLKDGITTKGKLTTVSWRLLGIKMPGSTTHAVLRDEYHKQL